MNKIKQVAINRQSIDSMGSARFIENERVHRCAKGNAKAVDIERTRIIAVVGVCEMVGGTVGDRLTIICTAYVGDELS